MDKLITIFQRATSNRRVPFVLQVLTTFLPIALLACGAAFYVYYNAQDRATILDRAREEVGIELGRNTLSHDLQEAKQELRFISGHHALKYFLDQPMPADLRDFEQDMRNLAATSRVYDQIRWLDETGMERVRVNYNNGNPVIVPAKALQNKGSRYYFTAAFKRERGEIYVSPLDLNTEHDRIETPHKSMLRIATPVFDSRGVKRGIVILNYLGAELLAALGKATAHMADHTMLLNQEGYWLKSPQPDEAWGFMFGRDQLTFARRHPAAWQRMLAADSGQFEDAEGLWTFKTIYPELEGLPTSELNSPTKPKRALFWKIVAHLSTEALYGNQPLLRHILVVLSAVLMMVFAGSWKLTRVRYLRNQAQDQVRQTNQRLEQLVEERTAELQTDIKLRKQTENALRGSEEKLQLFIEHAPAALAMFDREMRYIAVSRRWMIDYDLDAKESVIGRSHYEVFPEIPAHWKTVHRRGLSGEVVKADDERFERFDGRVQWLRWEVRPWFTTSGMVGGIMIYTEDITERKRIEERLRQASVVFESTREGVIITDAEQRILRVNPAFCELTGYTETEVMGQTPSLLNSGRQGRDFYAEMWASLNAVGHWQGEIWNRRKNGEIYPELLSISAITDDSGQAIGYVGIFADISKIKESEFELEFLAHHDPLTHLPNRLLLFSRLEHSIEQAKRENRQLALLMLDLDRFKDVNDSFGHLAGDELLQQVGGRLTARLRGVDTVCRLGGDEFTVTLLLEDISHPEDAARVANEIIIALSEPWLLAHGEEVRIGVSVGISLFPQHGNTAAELLQHADAALYQAKAEGRGRFMYFSENLTHAARERINLEARLRRAIPQNELRVYYQPQIDIASGRIVGAEALVRWQDPVEGLIPPGRFIPVAETTGLISAVGEWVLNETCLQGMRWLEEGMPLLTLAVNVSPHQFMRSNLVEVVSRVLAATGFPAASLELELTESALMDRQQEAVETLNRLRALGVRLAIDDFGTGYSSLAYLKRFPLDVLKIDKSFIDDIPASEDDKEIAAAIVGMAHTLRFKVLAEGVETVEQLAFLQSQGCDAYQGYLKSPPVPADVFAQLLAESRHE
jgi:diguanylate cyclase (GGDEF)-like protein/PAS domain S-box-containing protein